MTKSRNFLGAVLGSFVFTSSAGAVSVTVQQTGYVSQIGASQSTANQSPSASQTIQRGDAFTLTYTFDTTSPVVEDNSYLGLRALVYDITSLSINFSSGFSRVLPGHRIGVYASSNSATGEEYLSYGLFPAMQNGLPTIENFVAQSSDALTTQGTPYPASLDEVATNIELMSFKYGGYSVNPFAFGAGAGDCGSAYCTASFGRVSAGMVVNGSKPTLPTDPQVSAVPVPAPFAMLGVAFAGLLGFGRKMRGRPSGGA